ncbi:UNVERIFIED_CONTAM: iron complex transport system substrate-binding protein [Williamsia faeni]
MRVIATVAALIGATGCSSLDEDGDPSASMTAERGALPVTIEQNFGPVTIEKEPTRVAAVGPGDGDTLLALGIVPTTMSPLTGSEATRVVQPWNDELIGDTVPVVLPKASSDLNADIPKILATNPDLIVAVNAAVTEEQYNNLSEVAPTVLHEEQYPDGQVPWQAAAMQTGKAVGMPSETKKLIDETEKFFTDAQTEYPGIVGKKGAVITAGTGDGVDIYSDTDERGQTLTDLGMTFPAELAAAITGGLHGEISTENFDLLNSLDKVVAVDWQGSNDRLRQNAAFMNLAVVKRGGVVWVDQVVAAAMAVPTVLTIPYMVANLAPQLAE